MQICRGFTDIQWTSLRQRLSAPAGTLSADEDAWQCAIEVFSRRMGERYIASIEALDKADSKADVEVEPDAPADCSTLPTRDEATTVVPGFAILALCCLLIETLQSFRTRTVVVPPTAGPCTYPTGACVRSPNTTTAEAFKQFLRRPSFRGAFDDEAIAASFVRGVRNGILHEAETRKWIVWRDEPENNVVGMEEGRFVLNRREFYLAVRAEFDSYISELRNPLAVDLRQRFRKKMDDLVSEC